MTDKSDDRVEHLNTILVQGGGNSNDPIFKMFKCPGFAWAFEVFTLPRFEMEVEVNSEIAY